MKNKSKIQIIMTLSICGTCFALPSYGTQVCGKIYGTQEIFNDTFKQYGASFAYCNNIASLNPLDAIKLDTNYDWACVQYDEIISDAVPHLFMTYCSVINYACGQTSYFNGSGCTACPYGTAALEYDGYHTNTECPYTLCPGDAFYVPQIQRCIQCNEDGSDVRDTLHRQNFCICKNNFYWADTACIPCPDHGMSEQITNSVMDIEKCYLPRGDFADTTGEFTIDTEKCFYE